MKRDRPLPPELAKAFGHLQNLQYKGNGEFSSSCPVCGEQGHNPSSGIPDRFHMHEESGKYGAHGHCRRCGAHVWANQNNNKAPNPAKIKKEQELRREYEAKEAKRRHNQMEAFRQAAIWDYYHESMDDSRRLQWRRAGIPNEFQDLWHLGWTDNYTAPGIASPAMTLPYFAKDWQATTLQFRLIKPPTPNDKYRFLKGMQHQLFLTEPDRKMTGKCLLLEGGKKAMVSFINVVAEGRNHDYTVIAVPSATSHSLLNQLSSFDEVTVLFDPDQYVGTKNILGHESKPPIVRVLDKITAPIVKVAKLGVKADDMFVKYKATSREFMSVVNQAYQYKPRKSYSV